MSAVADGAHRRRLSVRLDGQEVSVPEGSTILEAAASQGVDVPTLCYLSTLSPINACRACVVEVEGSRALVPACSRAVTEGMVIRTDTDRVRRSRRLVLELLASSVDLSLASEEVQGWLSEYGALAGRFEPAPQAGSDRSSGTGQEQQTSGSLIETVAQPPKLDNDLYVRDYGRCILCYRCVEACGVQAQNTFAITVAGRGFHATIATEYDVPLPDSACVYCGNCVAVCPTGALMAKTEYDLRAEGAWDEQRHTITRTICPFCGVGCNLDLHVQDNRIVKVTSPLDHEVTSGHLCIKGRFGWEHVQNRPA